MGKFRKRVACKGKKWARGQSSSSNPEANKFRNAAKSKFFQVNLGNSGLTEFAVRKHEVMYGSVKARSGTSVTEMSNDQSVAGTSLRGTFKTFDTFASDWTNCSNISFSKLLNSFANDSAMQKEMLAILAAITEVIKEKNGTENSTEYFAALMTLLDGTLEGDEYQEDSVSAMLKLLSMGIKTVPRAVLQVKFGDATKILMSLLSKYAQSDNNIVMRSIIGCLSVLLRAQDAIVWSQPSTMKVYESILSFCAHSKPKIRKAAQHACCAMLKASVCVENREEDESASSSSSPPVLHPACHVTSAYVIRNIELNPALGGSTTTLHVLSFLKEIIGCLGKANVKACCESILKVMTLGNVLVISTGLHTLHSLFVSSPTDRSLTPALNAQLINALYDYQPPRGDPQPTLAWLTTLHAAFSHLASIDLSLAMANLTRFLSLCTQLWLSDKPEVVNGATHTIQVLIEDCVTKAAHPTRVSSFKPVLLKLFQLVAAGLSYQYNRAWKQILHVLATWFKATGATCAELMGTCLESLAELRDSYEFPHVAELDYTLGAAVRAMGVEAVLKHIPYQISGNEKGNEIKRSWLLPVLKANISSGRLSFFISYFLPLATLCRNKSAEYRGSDATISISYDLLQTQIWSLLPSFCVSTSDLDDTFPKLAKVLGNVLTHFKDLRLPVMLSLRKLIQDNPDSGVMKKYAKNYLPILLNIYTTQPKGTDDDNIRTSTFQTISLYASIADQALLSELLESAVTKIRKASDNSDESNAKSREEVKFLKSSILDVIRVLLPYQRVSDVEEMFPFLQETLRDSRDATETKKVYRILQELCESDKETPQVFISSRLEDVLTLLMEPMETKSRVPSQAARVKCLSALLPSMSEENIVDVIPAALAGIKSINSSCRDYSFQLITKIADRLLEMKQEPGLFSFVDNLSVGLQGSPKIASASILALASVSHHCRAALVGTEWLSTMLSNVLVLLTSSTREVVGSCLSYIKLLLTSFHKDDNAPHVTDIVREISRMTHDCKRHFRVKVKDIFVRLLRKYGDDVIFPMIPSHDVALVKQVKNMIKIRRRKSRERAKSNSESEGTEEEFSVKSKPKTITEILDEIEKEDDEDLVDVEEKQEKGKKKKKKNKKQTFIQEEGDDILDFTEMTNMSKISSTRPTSAAAKAQQTSLKGKKKDAFKLTEDGRLIITESDSEGEDEAERKMGKLKLGDEEQEDEASAGRILNERKRKRGASDKASVRSEPASKYQAGGSGIHRPIKSNAKSDAGSVYSGQDPGSVYKSKKSQGDMKRKGLPDPYAYVPLTRKLLNRRKKNKSTGQFKSIVKGAKKGAKLGSSMKSKNTKNNKRNKK